MRAYLHRSSVANSTDQHPLARKVASRWLDHTLCAMPKLPEILICLLFRLPYNIQIQKTGAMDDFSAEIHARF